MPESNKTVSPNMIIIALGVLTFFLFIFSIYFFLSKQKAVKDVKDIRVQAKQIIEDKKRMEDIIDGLKDRVLTTDNECADLNGEILNLQMVADTLQKEDNALKKSISLKEKDVAKLENVVNTVRGENSTLRSNLKKLGQEYKIVKKENAELSNVTANWEPIWSEEDDAKKKEDTSVSLGTIIINN